jgi:RNA polymerase sigma-70 factor (ECF subfamily)
VLESDAACRAAYAAHGGELYGFCLRRLGDAPAAEDAVQEVFVRAWRSAVRYDPAVASLRTWLFAIARNVVVDAHRARAARPVTVAEPAADAVVAPDGAEGLVQRLQLQEALAGLSPEHRHVVVEVVWRGRTSVDVAAELGASPGTVRSRLFHALRHLRGALAEEEIARA